MACALALGLSPITDAIREFMLVERRHHQAMEKLMRSDLLLRKQQAVESNAHARLMGLLAVGVNFADAQRYVKDQKDKSLELLKKEAIDLTLDD